MNPVQIALNTGQAAAKATQLTLRAAQSGLLVALGAEIPGAAGDAIRAARDYHHQAAYTGILTAAGIAGAAALAAAERNIIARQDADLAAANAARTAAPAAPTVVTPAQQIVAQALGPQVLAPPAAAAPPAASDPLSQLFAGLPSWAPWAGAALLFVVMRGGI